MEATNQCNHSLLLVVSGSCSDILHVSRETAPFPTPRLHSLTDIIALRFTGHRCHGYVSVLCLSHCPLHHITEEDTASARRAA
ncbi:unnamed protein product [Boreogadus saida]